MLFSSNQAQITRVVFQRGQKASSGGSNYATGLFVQSSLQATITQCSFLSNLGPARAALTMTGTVSGAVLDGLLFRNNVADSGSSLGFESATATNVLLYGLYSTPTLLTPARLRW